MAWVRVLVIAAIAVLLALYVRHLDWHAIRTSTADAGIALLVLGTLGNAPLIWLKAVRLRALVGGKLGTGKLCGFYVASYAADNLLMSQAGVGLRVALLRREGLPLATAITVQALEKLLEGIGLALLAVPLLATVELDPRLVTTIRWGLVIGGAAFALVAAFVLVNRRDLKIFQRIADTARLLRDPALAARVLALTMAAWAVEVAIVWATLAALHLPVASIATPVLVLVAVNLAALVPGLPANVGSFEMAAVLALASCGVTREPALAFAIVYHALHTIPVTIIGVLVGQFAHVAKAGPPRN
ncbi:MAG: lysylphosphatidylglycerol synthase transmembrane domain-containing protein [Acidobacteriota bacterium]